MGEKRVAVRGRTLRLRGLTTLLENFKHLIGCDYRSLALFRVFVGLTALGDILNRWGDIRAHYADTGFMPRHLVLSHFVNDQWLSVHMMGGTVLFEQIVFLIHMLIISCLIVGYKTRLMMCLTWFMTVSLHNRNILVLHGGDILMRMLMFFAMFLPLGEIYSLDAAFSNSKPKLRKDYVHMSVATLAIGLQLSWMYITSWYHKSAPEWRETGEATWLALQLDFFRTPIGDFLLQFPETLKLLTHAVLWWEGWGPYFWYVPIFTGPLRTFGTIGFSFMHLGFIAALRLGQFGLTGIFGVMVMFPSWFWENIVFKRLRTKERTDFRLYYNPNCSHCFTVARIFSTFFLIPESQVIALELLSHEAQSDNNNQWDDHSVVVDIKPSRNYSPSHLSNWLVAQDFQGVYHTNFNAFLAVCRVSPLLWPLYYLFRTRERIADIGNRLINMHNHATTRAPTRHVFSRARSERQVLVKAAIKYSKIVSLNVVCLFFLWFVMSWNAPNMAMPSLTTPPKLRYIAYMFHLDQSWAPPNVQWYYIFQGTLDNGTEGELFRNEGLFNWEITTPFTWEKPSPFWRNFKNHRWFKYYENGFNTNPNNEVLRLNFGRYICREYNSRHRGGAQLHKFSIHWMSEKVDPNKPNERTPLPKQTLWNHLCYEKKS